MSAAPLLTVSKNGETIKSVSIEGEALLGRSQDCVIRIEDRAISRQHILFKTTPQGIQVEKKSEFAPLIINGKDCTRALLKEGDIISIGPYQLHITNPVAAIPVPEPMPVAAPVARPTISTQQPAPHAEVINFPSEPAATPKETAPSDGTQVLDASAASMPSTAMPDLLSSASVSPLEDSSQAQQAMGLESNEIQNSDSSSPHSDGLEGIEPVSEDAATKLIPMGKLSVSLRFKPDQANVEVFEITKDQVYIGRGKGCDVVLNDKKSSRKNTVIKKAGLNFLIKDLDSSNGTYVDGQKITEQEITGECQIRIGDTEFTFSAKSKDYAERKDSFIQVDAPQEEEALAMESPSLEQMPLPAPQAMNSLDAPAMAPNVNMGAIANPAPQYQLQQNPTTGSSVGIQGIAGIGEGSSGKTSLVDRFKGLSPIGKIAVIAGIAFFIYWFNEEEAPTPDKKVATANKPSINASASPSMSYDSIDDIPANKRDWVKTQIGKAREAISTSDYDRAIAELELVTREFPTFTVANEMLRISQGRKHKVQAELDEKKRKEADERRKQRIVQLVDEVRAKMEKKDYSTAEALFAEVLELDPDNIDISRWRKEIQEIHEQKLRAQQESQIKEDIRKKAWSTYNEGLAIKKQKRYYEAIRVFEATQEIDTTDTALIKACKKMIASSRLAINDAREPLLKQAREAEEQGDIGGAFKLYEKAITADPHHKEAPKAIARLRDTLHQRAKALYTEGVLSESYSDFRAAKARFEEILTFAPQDDVYFGRAKRKISNFFRKDDRTQ